MKWQDEPRSENVEDRRGLTFGRGAVGGGAIVLALVAALLGAPAGTVRDILRAGSRPATAPGGPRDPPEERQVAFVKVGLRSTQTTRAPPPAQRGPRYDPPPLPLFTHPPETASGTPTPAVGPSSRPGGPHP